MKTFIIGEGSDRKKPAIERNADYQREQQEIREKLGIEDGFLPCFAPYEVVEIEGYFYLRSLSYDTDLQSTYYTALSRWHDGVPEPPNGVVLCPCGSKTFYIRYGEYECLGVCTGCGVEHSLYDG